MKRERIKIRNENRERERISSVEGLRRWEREEISKKS